MSAKSGAGSGQPLSMDVTILGRTFKVAYRDEERAGLAEAVAYLDRQMRDIRDRGTVAGIDRIAVAAALNIAHELLRERRGARTGTVDGEAARRRIEAMRSAIEQTLATQEKLF